MSEQNDDKIISGRAHSDRIAAESRAHADKLAAERIAHADKLAAERIAHADKLAAERIAHADRVAAENRAHFDRIAADRAARPGGIFERAREAYKSALEKRREQRREQHQERKPTAQYVDPYVATLRSLRDLRDQPPERGGPGLVEIREKAVHSTRSEPLQEKDESVHQTRRDEAAPATGRSDGLSDLLTCSPSNNPAPPPISSKEGGGGVSGFEDASEGGAEDATGARAAPSPSNQIPQTTAPHQSHQSQQHRSAAPPYKLAEQTQKTENQQYQSSPQTQQKAAPRPERAAPVPQRQDRPAAAPAQAVRPDAQQKTIPAKATPAHAKDTTAAAVLKQTGDRDRPAAQQTAVERAQQQAPTATPAHAKDTTAAAVPKQPEPGDRPAAQQTAVEKSQDAQQKSEEKKEVVQREARGEAAQQTQKAQAFVQERVAQSKAQSAGIQHQASSEAQASKTRLQREIATRQNAAERMRDNSKSR